MASCVEDSCVSVAVVSRRRVKIPRAHRKKSIAEGVVCALLCVVASQKKRYEGSEVTGKQKVSVKVQIVCAARRTRHRGDCAQAGVGRRARLIVLVSACLASPFGAYAAIVTRPASRRVR